MGTGLVITMAAALPTGAGPSDCDMPDAGGVWEHVDGGDPSAATADSTSGAGNSGEAMPTGGPVPGSSDETALAVMPSSSGVRRDADPSWQQGAYWGGKRSKTNQPADVPAEVWKDGIALEPMPGWQQLELWYAPGDSWKVMKVYAHPTATAGDLKWKVQDMVGIAHNACCLYGVKTETKLPWTDELLSFSLNNPEPLEERVLVPTKRLRCLHL